MAPLTCPVCLCADVVDWDGVPVCVACPLPVVVPSRSARLKRRVGVLARRVARLHERLDAQIDRLEDQIGRVGERADRLARRE